MDINPNEQMIQRTSLLMQPQLSSLDGHEHTQISALRLLLPDDRLIVLTRTDFALSGKITEAEIYPVFPRLAKSRAEDRERDETLDSSQDQLSCQPVPARFRSYLDALSLAVGQFEAGPDDLLVVPSAGPDEITLLVSYYEQLQGAQAPKAILRLLSADLVAGFSSSFLQRLQVCCKAGNLTLHTETVELRQHLETKYGLTIAGQFNLPCTIFPDQAYRQNPPKQFQREIKVGMLGRQRTEKGSYRIAGILKHLRQLALRTDKQQKIQIVYQAVRSKRLRRFMVEVGTWLSAYKNPNVTIQYVESGMSEERFRQLLLDVDILLLPYDIDRYQFSGSGIIMDGVLAQKPIVYSRGMAMQELLSDANAEAASSDREFAEKILKIISDYPAYRKSASAAAAYASQLLERSAEIFRK